MKKIVECVPNFSEGRKADVIDEIVGSMRDVPGVTLLDVKSDADHNRTVVSLVGTPEALQEAAFRGTTAAAKLIDMRQHKGAHPRIGAMDVIPFTPVRGVSMDDCVQIARRLGERIARELGIPVYLYESAATHPDRQNLADVRRGEFEGLSEEIRTNPDRAPDFGPAEMGPAGAVAVGARPFLIAFNVTLGTSDLAVAKAIAKAVRHSSGGYRYVKALGVPFGDVVQVSMNMTDTSQTPLHRVLETIRSEAERRGVLVTGSEIVGITPQKPLTDAARWYLGLHTFSDEQILENRLEEEETQEQDPVGLIPTALLDAVAAPTPTPGGGSVAALAAALGAALVQMYAGLTLGKESLSSVHREMEEIVAVGEKLREALADLVSEDMKSYEAVVEAYRMPKETDAQKKERREAIQDALTYASDVPMEIARLALRVLELAREVTQKGLQTALCDGGVAAYMAHAALRGALLNVDVNAKLIKDEAKVAAYKAEGTLLRAKSAGLANEIERYVIDYL